MFKNLIFISLIILLFSCGNKVNEIKVNNPDELSEAILQAVPGDKIIMANGVWKDVTIHFYGMGTEENQIVLAAETPGEVFIEGQSYLKFGGEHLIVEGLYFRNGFTPSRTVIDFKINRDTLANHCRLTNCVIDDFSQKNRYDADHWIEFSGRHNQVDHCYIAGKSNRGPTVRVNLKGNKNIRNYHKINNNHFGPRPRKGGPSAETVQIGSSSTSMSPSHVQVFENFFERCNGEVEVISSKSNFNEFRNNVFFECEGSLVTRHGNYCIIDGNFFIGNENSNAIGGIRVINTGHQITNNYFYKLKGEEFRSPLAIMNGIPKSPLNRYNQVTDIVVAFNTWVDCKSPWQFSVGANIDKSDVLPKSEIRSARPQRCLIANNIIYNQKADSNLIVAYDKVDGASFKNNLVNNQNAEFMKFEGIEPENITFDIKSEFLMLPSAGQEKILSNVYMGFEFESIGKDIFGRSRKEANLAGASILSTDESGTLIEEGKYGPDWFNPKGEKKENKLHKVSSAPGELAEVILKATDGDIIELTDSIYEINSSLVIDKRITISSKADKKADVIYSGEEGSPIFELKGKADLIIKNINLSGTGSQYTFSSLKEGMNGTYDLTVENVKINNFKYVLKTFKGSFADTVSFDDVEVKDCLNGIELAAETDDKGDYNAEFLFLENCSFKNIQQNVINFYRGGYDESTIGGNLTVNNCTFSNCGRKEKTLILIKTRGIINVMLSNNLFESNSVKYIAFLWGEKNNNYVDNKIINSGTIHEELYLKQKLMY